MRDDDELSFLTVNTAKHLVAYLSLCAYAYMKGEISMPPFFCLNLLFFFLLRVFKKKKIFLLFLKNENRH